MGNMNRNVYVNVIITKCEYIQLTECKHSISNCKCEYAIVTKCRYIKRTGNVICITVFVNVN